MVVIVDTFTVMQPTDHYASFIENFSFDILNAVQEQVSSDIYLSITGNNIYDGLTPQTPLQTIQYAMSIILTDSSHPQTIHLANGNYSPSTTGESFPIYVVDYVSINGESESGVILDAESVDGVMRFYNTDHTIISNLTLTGGSTSYYSGGGIYFNNSSPTLSNVTITGNSADSYGGGIYCEGASTSLLNSIVWNNSPEEVKVRTSIILIDFCDIEGGEDSIITIGDN